LAKGGWFRTCARTVSAALDQRLKISGISVGVAADLRRIPQHRLLSDDAAHHRREQLRHRVEHELLKTAAQHLPQIPLRPLLFPGGLEHRTAQLPRLVHKEGQHHDQPEDHG